MAIDGIGKSPISGAPSSVGTAGAPEGPGRAEFSVKSAVGTSASSAAGPVDTGLVGQLQSGQLTKDQYLDIRAEQAVHHLIGRIPAEKIEVIRATLREQLSTDPVLIAMVRRTTSMPSER